jgi:hypothetical protein
VLGALRCRERRPDPLAQRFRGREKARGPDRLPARDGQSAHPFQAIRQA